MDCTWARRAAITGVLGGLVAACGSTPSPSSPAGTQASPTPSVSQSAPTTTPSAEPSSTLTVEPSATATPTPGATAASRTINDVKKAAAAEIKANKVPSYDQISAEVSALYAANPNMAQVVGYSEQDILQAINSLEFGDARGRAGSGSTTFGLIYFHEGQLTGADKVATDIFARGQKDLGAQWDAQIAQDYPQG